MKCIIPIFLVSISIFFSGCFPGNSPLVKQQFAEISKMQLNQLVMHIEFYKLQNGHYPDSLEQLRVTDEMVTLTDFSAGMQATEPPNFRYERIGEKYTLFSSGMDGVPGTKDDFYPQIEIPDSSKIGLIVKHK